MLGWLRNLWITKGSVGVRPDAAHFTDLRGTTWVIDLTLGDVRRVRELCGVDLGEFAFEPAKLRSLEALTLGSVLVVLLSKQLDRERVTVEEFTDRIDGRVILEGALPALAYAVVGFFLWRRTSTSSPTEEPSEPTTPDLGQSGTPSASAVNSPESAAS
jgi:hypothetical protein